jgi:hypothetical protein
MPFDGTKLDEATRMLMDARGFIETGWCRNTQARAADGSAVEPDSDEAVSWCAYGALVRAGLRNGDMYHSAVLRFKKAAGGLVATFNNAQKTVDPVLDAFDRAISLE